MLTCFSAFQGLTRALTAFGFALFLAAPVSAAVLFVRDIVQPDGMSLVVPVSQAPYETTGPNYSPAPKPYFFTTLQPYTIDSSTGVVVPATLFPQNFKMNAGSVGAFAGQNAPGPLFTAVTSQRYLLTYNVLTCQPVSQTPNLLLDVFSSLAARSRDATLLSLIADNEHFTVDRITGELIARPLAGVDMTVNIYQSYGQDGMLHVLDYGHNRMASFDPDNAFALVNSFDLMAGITTANVQFGIGINGNFYLADGLGGGSSYTAAGAFQGTFGLPVDAVADPYTGASYISTDSAGRVYVFDSTTGFHQYQDASVVPEPATWGLVIGAGALLMARRRRRPAA